MKLETYQLIVRIVASLSLLIIGLLNSAMHPGILDLVSGGVTGLAIYAIWRAGGKIE